MAANHLLPQGGISATPDTLASMAQGGIANALVALGMDERHAQHVSGRMFNALNDLTPVGSIAQGYQAGQDLRNGHWLSGGLGAALAMLPGAPKKMLGKLARELPSLPHPSSLNLPRTPTAEEMSRLGRVDSVPLSNVRLGNKLQWDRFGQGDYGQPLVQGYSDKPLAVQMNNGEFVLLDGNHRAALAKRRGAESMPMHVISANQYDPANAGRAVTQPSSEDIDQLLAALSRP